MTGLHVLLFPMRTGPLPLSKGSGVRQVFNQVNQIGWRGWNH